MNKHSWNIISGALSGLAGAIAKSVFSEIRSPKVKKSEPYAMNFPHKKILITSVEEDRPKFGSLLSLGLGVLGGIGTHFAFKKQDRLVTKATSGFVIGSISDMLLKATKIKEPEQNKKFTMFLGNGLYGLVTAMVDKALGRFILETNNLNNYIEYMQVREEIKKKKPRLKRRNQENDLQKTS